MQDSVSQSNDLLLLPEFERLPDPTGPAVAAHAVYGGPLLGPGLIERFDAYRKKSLVQRTSLFLNAREGQMNEKDHAEDKGEALGEVVVFVAVVGSRLTGHEGVVHGGIVSLLFDEACGWGCIAATGENVLTVTGNLSVNFRKPLRARERCVLRVFHEGTERRKVSLRARLENVSGDEIYADATCTYIMLRSRL
uniref:Thioesterase domain-containing protein n=1 Tax=Pseudictyota dubia TaxID=2749911 RepID=A0A7R9W4Z3_9STRA|mmetsp:Transcript_34140/g.63163  ORF Transcript_34140/g.63163 Transcript_34140/m.63163 type:complete len:194 (+) Transcript_34140:96-677(+)